MRPQAPLSITTAITLLHLGLVFSCKPMVSARHSLGGVTAEEWDESASHEIFGYALRTSASPKVITLSGQSGPIVIRESGTIVNGAGATTAKFEGKSKSAKLTVRRR